MNELDYEYDDHGRYAQLQTQAIHVWIKRGNYVDLNAILGPAAEALEMIEAAIEAESKPSKRNLEKAARGLREGFEKLWGVNSEGPSIQSIGFWKPHRNRSPFGVWHV